MITAGIQGLHESVVKIKIDSPRVEYGLVLFYSFILKIFMNINTLFTLLRLGPIKGTIHHTLVIKIFQKVSRSSFLFLCVLRNDVYEIFATLEAKANENNIPHLLTKAFLKNIFSFNERILISLGRPRSTG